MDFTHIFNRSQQESQIIELLTNFQSTPLNIKRNIYIQGPHGIGKSTFIMKLLNKLQYDIIRYDSVDIRNTHLIESLSTSTNFSNNVLNKFKKTTTPVVILLDDIDSINAGDKSIINSLIKLIRPKKNKKQKQEPYNSTPIICIGNLSTDKQLKELYNVCNIITLYAPTTAQITTITSLLFQNISSSDIDIVVQFIKNDLTKLITLHDLYKDSEYELLHDIQNVFLTQISQYDSKLKTKHMLTTPVTIKDHDTILNETERIIINKLWHENVVDTFIPDVFNTLPIYVNMLHNICFADYLDRITFQKQIWQFNEMSSLIKTFKNNMILHTSNVQHNHVDSIDVRFTKILTKYSTEYNNFTFIRNICQTLNIDKKDLITYMHSLESMSDVDKLQLFENYNITNLDITRLTKYTRVYTNTSIPITTTDCSEEFIDTYELLYQTNNNHTSILD
jgi:hypothetical protein